MNKGIRESSVPGRILKSLDGEMMRSDLVGLLDANLSSVSSAICMLSKESLIKKVRRGANVWYSRSEKGDKFVAEDMFQKSGHNGGNQHDKLGWDTDFSLEWLRKPLRRVA